MPRHQLTPEERARGTQFQKGKTGNTLGVNQPTSARGIREAKRKEWSEELKLGKDVLLKVQAKTVEKALDGDVFACSVIFRHNVAIPRSEAQPQKIPGFDAGDAVASAEAIFRAVAAGELSIERGNLAMTMIYQRCQ